MSGIKQQTLTRALAMLKAIGASYAVIDADGKKHGNLEVSEQKKRNMKRPYGTLSKYVGGYMEDMQVGDVKEIPFGDFKGEETRSAAVSWACHHWGNGTITTATVQKKKVVEALRIA